MCEIADITESTIFPRPAVPWQSKVSTASRCHLETPDDCEQVRGEDMRTQQEIEIERERENVSDRQAPLLGPKPGLDTIQNLAKRRAMASRPLNSLHPSDSFQTDPKAALLWVAKSIPDSASPFRKTFDIWDGLKIWSFPSQRRPGQHSNTH